MSDLVDRKHAATSQDEDDHEHPDMDNHEQTMIYSLRGKKE